METKFNFKSQISTSRVQSERLLELGLKKETADMVYEPFAETSILLEDSMWDVNCDLIIPAWSLHRLIEMRLSHDEFVVFQLSKGEDPFEKVISHIEHAIKEGYFNKEYLED